MRSLSIIDWIALILVIIGGLNWGIFGLFHYDLVAMVAGDYTNVSRAAYAIVGLAAVYLALISPRLSRK